MSINYISFLYESRSNWEANYSEKQILKTGYIGDERAKKSKEEWRGNPEISNRTKSPYYPKGGRDKGKDGYYWSPETGSSRSSGNYPASAERDETTEQVELQPAMLPGVERL